MEFAGFEWDEGNRTKCNKHGVSINDVEDIFRLGVMVLPDETHSEAEQRFRAIGRVESGRALFIVFTIRERGPDKFIRPISARYMHKKEIEHYEKNYRT